MQLDIEAVQEQQGEGAVLEEHLEMSQVKGSEATAWPEGGRKHCMRTGARGGGLLALSV